MGPKYPIPNEKLTMSKTWKSHWASMSSEHSPWLRPKYLIPK